MTVKELIEFLQTQPQDIQVAFRQYSEYRLIELNDIDVQEHCEVRPDGWVQHRRPDDYPTQQYLMFPGN